MAFSERLKKALGILGHLDTVLSVLGWTGMLGGAALLSIGVAAWGYFWNLPGPILVTIFIVCFSGLLMGTNQVLLLRERTKEKRVEHDVDLPINLQTIFLASECKVSERAEIDLIGIFNKLHVDQFPHRRTFIALANINFASPLYTDFKVRYAVVTEDDDVIHVSSWEDLSKSRLYPATMHIVSMENVTFQKPGTYFICLEIEPGGIVGRRSLTVVSKQIVRS